MDTKITLKFILSRSEYQSAIRQSLIRRPAMLIVAVLLVAWMGFPFLTSALRHREAPGSPFLTQETLIYPAIGGAALIYLFGVTPLLAYRRINPAARDQEQEFRFYEGGAEARNAVSEAKFDWKSWVNYRETGSFFFLYPSARSMHLLPKRAFASSGEIDAFRDLLKRKLPR